MTELEAIELELIDRELANRQGQEQQQQPQAQPEQSVLPEQVTQNTDVQLMADWLKRIPFGRRLSSMASGKPLENIDRTLGAIPEPQSKTFGMAMGKALPDIAMATPFMRGAGMIPKIPAFLKAGAGLGAYAGTKAAAQNQPVLPAALQGAGSGMAMHGLGRGLSTLIPASVPFGERIGSAAAGAITGKAMGGDNADAAFYGAMGGAFPSQRLDTTKQAQFLVKNFLRPKKSLYDFGKSPERALVKEGIWGVNFDAIDKKASNRLSELNQYKDRLKFDASNMGVRVNLEKPKVFQPIDDVLTELRKAPESHKATIRSLERNIRDLTMAENAPKNFSGLTIDQAYELRDIVNNLKPTGIFSKQSDSMISSAMHKTYHNIVEAINNSGISPELRGVNKRIADLISTKEAINDATNRNPNMWRFIPFGVLGGAGYMAGGGIGATAALGAMGLANTPGGATMGARIIPGVKRYPKIR